MNPIDSALRRPKTVMVLLFAVVLSGLVPNHDEPQGASPGFPGESVVLNRGLAPSG